VRERGENVALTGESLGELRMEMEVPMGQFECDRAPDQTIGTRRKPYGAHTAVTYFAHKAIGSNHLALVHTGHRLCFLGAIGGYREFWQRVEQVIRLRARLARKQFTQSRSVSAKRFRQALEPLFAAFCRQFPCFVQQTREGDQLVLGQLHDDVICSRVRR